MNYYEHHLGDYLRDTAHLSMLEDGAYRRLLDAYYIRETPLPPTTREVFRLVRAQSKQDREAVETVLREFFTETPDGWRHGRCDREIARYHETIPEREAKRENDRERQRRARERRKVLFEQLREHGIVPPFDAKTSELEAMLSRGQSRGVTQPVTRDNTATHTPDTRPNTSVPNGTDAKASQPTPKDRVFAFGVPLLTSASVSDKNARSMLAGLCKRHGEQAVADAIDRCAIEQPIEPVSWLQAALKPNGSHAPRRGAEKPADIFEAGAV